MTDEVQAVAAGELGCRHHIAALGRVLVAATDRRMLLVSASGHEELAYDALVRHMACTRCTCGPRRWPRRSSRR